MQVRREFHQLNTGDLFSFEQGGPVYLVDDANYIDTHQGSVGFEDRLVMYRAEDGEHGHLANHDVIWLVIN